MDPCAQVTEPSIPDTALAALEVGRTCGGELGGVEVVRVCESVALEDCFEIGDAASPVEGRPLLQNKEEPPLKYDHDNCVAKILRALTESEQCIEPDTQTCSDDALSLATLAEEPRLYELHNPIQGSVRAEEIQQLGKRWEDEYEDEVNFGFVSDSNSMGLWCPDKWLEESTELGSPESSASSVCSSAASMDSIADYFSPDETIIIFDWDDTICPTTALIDDSVLEGCSQALQDLVNEVRKTLERAREVAAEVVIVTNATEGWVESSCERWMPSVRPVLDMLEFTSARSNWEPMGITSPTGWKAAEFEEVVKRFYSRYWRQSWKNVIVIGDASYEHEALSVVAKLAPEYGRCRAKSIRFVAQPSIELLARELQMLRENFHDIVHHDGKLDLCFYSESL